MESRLYSFDQINGTESNLENMNIFLKDENERIHEELLDMNNYELKIASSILSKWLFLRNIKHQQDVFFQMALTCISFEIRRFWL